MATPITNPTTGTTTVQPIWALDPAHSAVQFSAKHMMITTVRGRFNKFDVKLNLDEKDPTNSSVEVIVDAATLDTREPSRDNHLRSADFLEVEKYPTITFKSQRVERVGEDHYRVIGDLTIRDV